MRLALIVAFGGTRTLRTFDREVVTLGRDDFNAIAVDDAQLSRTHCQFERLGGAVYVRDLGSRNGTFVMQEAITRRRLEPGDVVRAGRVEVTFEGWSPALDAADDGDVTKSPRVAKAARRDLRQENTRLRQLLAITRRLIADMDEDRFLESLVDTAVDFTGAERGFLVLMGERGPVVEVARSLWRRDVPEPHGEISTSVVERVVRERVPLILDDARADRRFRAHRSVAALDLRSILCVPLEYRAEVLGALYLDNRFLRGTFRADDREMVDLFADLAAVALDQRGRLVRARDGGAERSREDLLSARERGRGVDAKPVATRASLHAFVVHSPAMRSLAEQLQRIAPTELPVLIGSPPGTDAEALARWLHEAGLRPTGPFVPLACAALPASLAEVELFGHASHAFSGSVGQRPGILAAADGGTLFLDRVDDLDLPTQALFLRALDVGEYRPVGDSQMRRSRARVVASTSRPLETRVEEGRFRSDLYFRLAGVRLALPTLSERPEDLPELLRRILDEDAPELVLTPRARKTLLVRPWPGNELELRNEVRRLRWLGPGPVDVEHLSVAEPSGGSGTLDEQVNALERRLVEQALSRSQGNRSRAALALGLSRPGLRKKMDRLGL